MELTNEFRVGVPVARAWAVLTDVERIAPCMPGAQLQEIEGDEYRGIVKVKVGPITAQYKGKATFIEMDEAAHRCVLRAEGRETRGQGNANATITATLLPDGDATTVTVLTDLTVTGRVAQFGRGVLADVSAKLLDQFVACLESDVLVAEPASVSSADAPGTVDPAKVKTPDKGHREHHDAERIDEAPIEEIAADEAPIGTAHAHFPNGSDPEQSASAASTIRRIDAPEPKPVDLLDTAGAPLAKRVGPIAVVLVVLWLLRRWSRRRGDA